MSVSGRIRAYQVVSRCPRYALIRPDTVPIHADTKSAPLSSVSDCKIQRDDSKKRDRVRISDVSTSVSGIVSAIMYLPVSVVCIVLYRTAYHTLYPRSCIALVSKHVSWVYQKDVSSHAYRTCIALRIARVSGIRIVTCVSRAYLVPYQGVSMLVSSASRHLRRSVYQ